MDNIDPISRIIIEKATENMMLLYFFISNVPHIMNIIPIEAINGAMGSIGLDNEINKEPNNIKQPKITYIRLVFIVIT